MKTKNILEHNDTEDLEEMEPKMAGSHAYHEGKEILKEDKKKSEFQWQRNCLESLEARIIVHQKNEVVYEEDIAFLKYDVKVRDNSITELKNLLAEALREKDDLKPKLEKFETSSIKLTKLINSQISVNNKFAVGFDSQMNTNELHDCHLNKNEVFESASDSSVNETKEENNQVNDSVPRNESTASKSSKDSLEQPKDVRPSAHTNLISSDTEKLQELTETHTQTTSSSRSQHTKLSRANRLLTLFKAKPASEFTITRISFQSLQMTAEISSQIQKAIDHHIPSQVDASVRNNPQLQQQDIAIWLALQMKFENLQVPQTTCRPSAVRPRDQDDPHDDAHPEGENSAKRQKTSEYEAYVSGESSSGQVNEEERGPSTSGNQEQEDDYDFWTDSYASDDDEIPTKQVSQDIMEEVSLTIDEAKLKKMADEMLRQRCTSGDEHQYHIDQMKNFLQSDIVWETPALSLINQDLLYLKKGSSGPEKIVLSLHKFPAIIFNDDDIEERTSRWVNKCVKKFNPYARYGVEHWKNPHAKIFYIRKQKEPGKPKEDVYLNSKIIQVIKTYWELGHEHKFVTEIVARRANECIVSITKPDYKNLNKNDIEDMYLIIMNGKVPDYAETGLLWSLSVFIRKRELTNDEVEYLKLFEEEIEVRLKHRNQMRRWEMYVNGRLLGPRSERPK
ncbi:hypothetical protein Tco_0481039 [Tanacetum coccineum]